MHDMLVSTEQLHGGRPGDGGVSCVKLMGQKLAVVQLRRSDTAALCLLCRQEPKPARKQLHSMCSC